MGGEWYIACESHREVLCTNYRHLWSENHHVLPKDALARLRHDLREWAGIGRTESYDDRLLTILESFLTRHSSCEVRPINGESDEFESLGLGGWTVGWKEFDTAEDSVLSRPGGPPTPLKWVKDDIEKYRRTLTGPGATKLSRRERRLEEGLLKEAQQKLLELETWLDPVESDRFVDVLSQVRTKPLYKGPPRIAAATTK